MKLSHHASQRLQQRAIPAEVLDILDAFGIEESQRGGTVKQRLPKREVEAIKRKLKKAYRFFDQLDASFCVKTDDDFVVTVGHHYK